MILDKIKIHDKHSFEIKFNYKLGDSKKNTSYRINSYFFIPSSLDINRKYYKKEDFYNDVKTYIRLKTPTFIMRDLTYGKGNPLEKLKKSCLKISQNNSSNNFEEFEYFLKMFCSISQSSIRDSVSHIAKSKICSGNN